MINDHLYALITLAVDEMTCVKYCVSLYFYPLLWKKKLSVLDDAMWLI